LILDNNYIGDIGVNHLAQLLNSNKVSHAVYRYLYF